MTWHKEMADLARFEDLFRRLSEQSDTKQSQYGKRGDPSNHVEFESELKRQAAAKIKKRKKG